MYLTTYLFIIFHISDYFSKNPTKAPEKGTKIILSCKINGCAVILHSHCRL